MALRNKNKKKQSTINSNSANTLKTLNKTCKAVKLKKSVKKRFKKLQVTDGFSTLTTPNIANLEFKVETIDNPNSSSNNLECFEDDAFSESDFFTPIELNNDCKNAVVNELINASINKFVIKEINSEVKSTVEDATKVQYIYLADVVIIILPHSSTTYFYGLMTVEVLHGAVEVLGYTLNNSSGVKELFSPRGCSCLYLKNKGEHHPILLEQLSLKLVQHTGAEKICNRIKESDCVLLCKKIDSIEVDFLVNHIPQEIYPDLKFLKCVKNDSCIQINSQWDALIKDMNTNSKVLLAGGKGVGKSTMMRYMINKLLMDNDEVTVIDLDPGQPEFTVPGCISISNIREPIFGPNFTHLRDPKVCLFIPNIDISRQPHQYIKVVIELMTYYENISRKPTIVNFMGFTRGLGLHLFSSTVVSVKPTCIIEIRSSNVKKNFTEEISAEVINKHINVLTQFLLPFSDFQIITLQSMSDQKIGWQLQPRQIREMCVLSYLGRVMNKNEMYLANVTNFLYVISLSSINLICKDTPVSPAIVNGNVVALCSSTSNSYICYGWGVVRALNFEAEELYLLTPVAENVLSQVTTLILGSVTLPPSVIMNTSNADALIPYVSEEVHGSDEYECNECNYKIVRERNLKYHMKSHMGNEYKCIECEYKTVQKCNLKYMKNHISKEYKCKECDYKTERECNLKYHMKNDNGVKVHMGDEYKCKECDYKTVWEHDLKALKVHKGDEYKCKECDCKTVREHNLKAQMNIHTTGTQSSSDEEKEEMRLFLIVPFFRLVSEEVVAVALVLLDVEAVDRKADVFHADFLFESRASSSSFLFWSLSSRAFLKGELVIVAAFPMGRPVVPEVCPFVGGGRIWKEGNQQTIQEEEEKVQVLFKEKSLLRRANCDYLPIKTESQMLTSSGLDILTNIFTTNGFYEVPCQDEIFEQVVSIATNTLIERSTKTIFVSNATGN
ncbi:hypothetical protein FQA39_LY09783 [Lamprigera yunnana]|nr:hypothetical protein FQA39_LY09783 [Lamprigera yunnana]